MLRTFFYPYFSLIYGAAWNIQQSLEGLGLTSSNFIEHDRAGNVMSSYWSPAQAVLPILGLLVVLVFALSMLFVLAGYVLRGKSGALMATFLLCLPGLLSVLSLWPALSLLPDMFVISGNGVLGSGWGMAPLLGIGVLAGWTGFILLSDMVPLGENFAHLYDHFWCLSGLIAAIFFVADSQVGQHARDLQDSERIVQQASAYLSRQANAYGQQCTEPQQRSPSCRWAADVQQKLLDYATQGATLYREFGPKSAADVYSVYGRPVAPAEVAAIRKEIVAYNAAICPITRLGEGVWQLTQSPRCLQTPAAYCTAFPEPLNGEISRAHVGGTAALSTECIVPTLVALRAHQEKLLAKVDEDLYSKHYRWMYYLFFSVVVGEKISTSSVKLSAMHRRPIDDARRSLRLGKRFCLFAFRLVLYCYGVVSRGLARMLRLTEKTWRAVRRSARRHRWRKRT